MLDYLFILKLTPLLKEWQPECTKMMKANFGARVSDDKIEKMAKSFSAFCRTAWVKARHQRKTFMHKHRVRLEQELLTSVINVQMSLMLAVETFLLTSELLTRVKNESPRQRKIAIDLSMDPINTYTTS